MHIRISFEHQTGEWKYWETMLITKKWLNKAFDTDFFSFKADT